MSRADLTTVSKHSDAISTAGRFTCWTPLRKCTLNPTPGVWRTRVALAAVIVERDQEGLMTTRRSISAAADLPRRAGGHLINDVARPNRALGWNMGCSWGCGTGCSAVEPLALRRAPYAGVYIRPQPREAIITSSSLNSKNRTDMRITSLLIVPALIAGALAEPAPALTPVPRDGRIPGQSHVIIRARR